MTPAVFTVPEVAKILRIGRAAACKLVDTGQLGAIRIGRSIRVPASTLETFVANGNVGPTNGTDVTTITVPDLSEGNGRDSS